MNYNAKNWYWSGQPQGQSGTIIFSSAKGAVVAATDPGYQAFLAAGGIATPWPLDPVSRVATTAALDVVLSGAGLPPSGLTPPTPAQLLAYAEALRGKIAAGGISVNIAASGAPPQLVEVGTDTAGLALLANAVQLTSTAPGTPYNWDQAEPVTLTGAQIVAIQVAVGLFNQLLFSQKTAIRAAIAAGTITTFAQIDTPASAGLPAWPANS
ncbi:DUF4376 domain-containing protein [Rhodoblastus sp.]|uniref:DUF4376 domain-containing protein n=1 Tax=Rhodoblastus sp. TaxID=1962975 RepID=UPI003F9506F2